MTTFSNRDIITLFRVEQRPARRRDSRIPPSGGKPKPMNPQTALKQFGLTDKEIKIYLASLELGTASVLNIAKKAKLKRPTAYVVLESLLEKGLVSEVPRKNKTLFVAEDPELLTKKFKEREQSLIESLPYLKSIYNISEKKPKVRFYDGKSGVETVYDKIMSGNEEIIWFGSIAYINKNIPRQTDKFIKLALETDIPSREIITETKEDFAYAKKISSPKNQVRVLPNDLNFYIDCSLFQNKVAIFSLDKDLFVVVIESEQIYKSFKSIFELAWRAARPI